MHFSSTFPDIDIHPKEQKQFQGLPTTLDSEVLREHSGPLVGIFRHALSPQNDIEREFDMKYKIEFASYAREIPLDVLFQLVTEYIVKKIQLGDDMGVDITLGGIESCEPVNLALREVLESSGRKIRHVMISPYYRTISTAQEILGDITSSMNIRELLEKREIQSRRGKIDIALDNRVRERDFGSSIGYYHTWARKVFENPVMRKKYVQWVSEKGGRFLKGLSKEKLFKFYETVENTRSTEKFETVRRRINSAVQQGLNNTGNDEFAAIFTHTDPIRALVGGNMPGKSANILRCPGYSPHNTGMTVIGKLPGKSSLKILGYNLLPTE